MKGIIRKKKDDGEHREQVITVNWFKRAYPHFSELLIAIPNGGHRHLLVAKKLKAEGVQAGFPDLFLFVSASNYHGLAVEMKDKIREGKAKPRLSTVQKEKIKLLNSQNYYATAAFGFEQAQEIFVAYLSNDL